MRKIIGEVQKYSLAENTIDEGLLMSIDDNKFETVIGDMKKKHFNSMRKWINVNANIGVEYIYDYFFKNCDKIFIDESIPMAIIIIENYLFKSKSYNNDELNLTCSFTEIMSECKFK